jgi:O-antigen ligase
VPFLLFVLYVVLAYLQPGELIPVLAPYRITYWVGMTGLAVAFVSLLRGGITAASVQLWALVAFTAVMGLSLAVAKRWPGAPLDAVLRFGPSLTMFVLALCSITSLRRLRAAASIVLALTVVLVLQGAAAYHLGFNARLFLFDRAAGAEPDNGDAVHDAHSDPFDEAFTADVLAQPEDDPDPARIRALGFMHDPNDLAMAMVVALGLIGGAWQPRHRLHNLALAAAGGALVYGIYLTRSRGGAVALLAVLWRFAATRIGVLPAFGLTAALAAGAMTIDYGGRSLSIALDASAADRLVAWTEGFEMLKSSPILGVGYGQFIDHHPLTAHNSLVLCFAETGLLGSFFWIALFVVSLLDLRRLRALAGNGPFDDAARRWAEGLQLALVGFVAAACFLSRTFVPTLYLLLGLSAALAVIARRAGRPIVLPALPVVALIVLACEIAAIGLVYAMVKLHVA